MDSSLGSQHQPEPDCVSRRQRRPAPRERVALLLSGAPPHRARTRGVALCAPVRAAPVAAGERRLDLRAARPDERCLRSAGAERVRPVAPRGCASRRPSPLAQAAGCVGAPGDLRDALQAERRRAAARRAGDRSHRLPITLAHGADGRLALGRGRPAVRGDHPRDPDRPRRGPVSLVAATLHCWRCAGVLPVQAPVSARPRRRLWTNAARGDVTRLGLLGLGPSRRPARARLTDTVSGARSPGSVPCCS